MRSYTSGRNQYGRWSKNTTSVNLTDGDLVANDTYRHICAMKDWPFLERVRTLSTTANTQFKNLPYDCDQVREVSVLPLGSTYRRTPKLSPSPEHWDQLNMSTFTSDFAEWYFIRNGQIGLWPIPATTGGTITIDQKTRVIDLSIADITSSTVASIANGATTLTVSAGLVNMMTGMWINITYNPGVTNTGDGVWYEIASVTSSTVLELVRAYGGTTISAGTAACTIAQMPLLPEAFQDMPWLRAAGMYWMKESDSRSEAFLSQYGTEPAAGTPATGLIGTLIKSYSSPTTSMVIDGGDEQPIINPNLVITL